MPIGLASLLCDRRRERDSLVCPVTKIRVRIGGQGRRRSVDLRFSDRRSDPNWRPRIRSGRSGVKCGDNVLFPFTTTRSGYRSYRAHGGGPHVGLSFCQHRAWSVGAQHRVALASTDRRLRDLPALAPAAYSVGRVGACLEVGFHEVSRVLGQCSIQVIGYVLSCIPASHGHSFESAASLMSLGQGGH